MRVWSYRPNPFNVYRLLNWKIFPIFISVFVLLLGACSHTPAGDFKRQFDQASRYFGDDFEFYYVPSAGWFADREFVRISPPGNPSADARRLASIMKSGEDRLTKLAVYCPSANKMAAILLNAVYINRDKELLYLEVLYIGDDAFELKLSTAIACAVRLAAEHLGIAEPVISTLKEC